MSRARANATPRHVLTAACALLVALTAVLALVALADEARRPAVVTVRVTSAAGVPERAIGTVVAPGRVLTVDHVLASGDRVVVEGEDGVRRAATPIRRHPGLDLALLRVPGATGPRVRFGEAGGDELRVLTAHQGRAQARPAYMRGRVVARIVDQPGRPRRPSLDLAVDVAAGDSGAPVVDDDGDVVGVVYARSTRRVETAYAVRGDVLRRLVG